MIKEEVEEFKVRENKNSHEKGRGRCGRLERMSRRKGKGERGKGERGKRKGMGLERR